MFDDNSTETTDDLTLSRRDFGKATAGATLLAPAADPAAADRLRANARAATAETTLSSTFTPESWYAIGPFQYQRRDTGVGWLFPSGGTGEFADGEETPTEGDSLPSAFAAGSAVEWRTTTADGDTVSFPQLAEEIDPTGGEIMSLKGGSGLFDDLQDWYGLGGIIYGAGYVFTTFERSEATRAVLETDATVWLNGDRYEEPPCGVVLQEGTNYLLAEQTLIFGTSGAVSLSFRPPAAPVEVNELDAFRGTPQNVVVPDLRVGEDDTDLPASVRVTNTTGERVEEATLEFAPESDVLVSQTVEVDPPLAPFETRRVNTRVQLADPEGSRTSASIRASKAATRTDGATTVSSMAMTHSRLGEAATDRETETTVASTHDGSAATFDLSGSTLSVLARVTVDDASHERRVPIRVRERDENRRQSTFTSRHDESVQTFAYRRPTNVESGSGPWRLVVSLHGANVPAINQAGANVAREDTFVVAPAARGPVNYDHEDLGRLDDLEAMAVMRDRFDVDDSRVYLSGHSMGGHGTWHLGLTHSDEFASIGPSAGWTDHETYITATWGRDKLHTYPRLKAVKETALQKNLAMPKAHNAADGNTPVFALHGGDDQSVPPLMPRSYLRTLANEGLTVDGEVGDRYPDPDPDRVDAAYLEVPGAGHWWDKGIGPGNDGINHPDMWSYLFAAENDPYPADLSFFTTNLRVEHQKHWVRVLEQETVHAPTRVDASLGDDGLAVRTENVRQFALDTRVFTEADAAGARSLTVDGKSASVPGSRWVTVDLADGVSAARGRGDEQGGGRGRGSDARKGPEQYGPMVEVHHSPYRLVYGTQGSAEETALNRTLANLRSQRLVDRARAPAPVVPDTAVDDEMRAAYNLVLFGRPESNGVYRRLAADLPVAVRGDAVHVGGNRYTGDLGVEFCYPDPESDNLLQVSTGTSMAGVRLTGARDWTPTQTATADYHVFDETVRYQRWNASLAAGFFDADWELDERLGFRRDVRTARGPADD